MQNNIEECGFDYGDCILFNAIRYPDCDVSRPYKVGDGYCNTVECGFDGGDCIDNFQNQFNLDYPNCKVQDPTEVCNGRCRGHDDCNNVSCGCDGGDCFYINMILNEKYTDCKFLDNPYLLGDGECNGGAYGTLECGWGGGDCNYFNTNYPDCNVSDPTVISNGICQLGWW
jgi:hypothetical protein